MKMHCVCEKMIKQRTSSPFEVYFNHWAFLKIPNSVISISFLCIRHSYAIGSNDRGDKCIVFVLFVNILFFIFSFEP